MDPMELITRFIHGTLVQDRECKFASDKGSVTHYLSQGSFTGYLNNDTLGEAGRRKLKISVEFVL